MEKPFITTALLFVTSIISLIYPTPKIHDISSINYKPAEVLSAEIGPSVTPINLDYIVITETPMPTPTFTPTPTPTPSPIPPTVIPLSDNDLNGYFLEYSSDYHVDINILKKIANCESHFHATSQNGPYAGMFQFSEGAWVGARQRMGQNTDINLRFNAEEAIKTAAYKISQDGTSAWINCSR